MKRIVMLNCLRANSVCTGAACLQAFNAKTKTFVGQVSVIIKVISHELGIILDDDAQLFGTGDEIPDLLAGLAQGHRLQAGLPLLCADNGKNIENREHQNDDHYSGYIEFHQRTKEPGQLFFHTHHLQL